MEKRQTQIHRQKVGVGWSGLLAGETKSTAKVQHVYDIELVRESRLLCIADQGGGAITPADGGGVLASLGRCSLWRAAVFKLKTSREKKVMVHLYFTQCQHLHIDQKERPCHFSLSLVLREGFAVPS